MDKVFVLSFLFFVVFTGLAWAAEPVVETPYLSQLVIPDGRIDVNEWSDAAVVRDISILSRQARTTFFVKYDEKNVYVAAVCEEHEKGYPKAFARGPEDQLTDDDAITVALGTAGGTEGKVINVGGYAGAMNQTMGPMAYLYEFIVNSAGATARRYNESPLNHPGFTAGVGASKNVWTVEMQIPLESAGIVKPEGKTVYINFLRSRPPELAGWQGLAARGNYTPYQVGKLIFLSKGQEGLRTVELPPKLVPAPPPAAPPNHKVEPSALSTMQNPPEWLNTKAGLAYIHGKIPQPWTLPIIEENEVILAHARLKFADNGLPNHVRNDQGELLTGDPVIAFSIQNQPVKIQFDPVHLAMSESNVVIAATGEFSEGTVQIQNVLEFDGFLTVRMRILSTHFRQIDRLQISIPFERSSARYINRGSVQDTRQLTGFGYEGPGGNLWIGSEDQGLAFSCDYPLFLSQDARRQIQVIEEEQTTNLVLNVADRAGQIKRSGQVFQFYLQPTPTKKPTLAKANERFDLWFENWSDYQGYPDLKKMEEIKKFSAAAQAKGKLGLLYFSQMLAENAPGFAAFRKELIAPPEKMWYKRAYDPGKGVPCYVCCVRGPYGDLLLNGIERLVREGNIGGLYMDGTTFVWECNNPCHADCVQPENLDWDQCPSGPILGTRRFLKRLRGIFDERNRPFLFVGHTGGALDINTLSFVDNFWEGEQLARFLPGYQIPLSVFSVGYGGRPWGYGTMFYDQGWRAGRVNRSLIYALLHDAEVQNGLADRFYAGFQDEKTTVFYPFWRNNRHVGLASKTKRSVLSYYRRDDAAMVIVGNLTSESDRVTIDLNGLYPDQPISVTDLLTSKPIETTQGCFTANIADYRGLVLQVTPRKKGEENEPIRNDRQAPQPSPIEKPFEIVRYDPADWQVNRQDPGVTVNFTERFGENLTGMKIGSQPYQPAAKAVLAEKTVGRNAIMKFRVKIPGRFTLQIGPVSLTKDGSWTLLGPLDGWNEGCLNQISVAPEQTCELEVFLRDGVLDILCNGQPLTTRMAFLMPESHNQIGLSTWAGNWLAFTVTELSNRPD